MPQHVQYYAYNNIESKPGIKTKHIFQCIISLSVFIIYAGNIITRYIYLSTLFTDTAEIITQHYVYERDDDFECGRSNRGSLL